MKQDAEPPQLPTPTWEEIRAHVDRYDEMRRDAATISLDRDAPDAMAPKSMLDVEEPSKDEMDMS